MLTILSQIRDEVKKTKNLLRSFKIRTATRNIHFFQVNIHIDYNLIHIDYNLILQ